MSNANIFISLYNKTDHYLKEQIRQERNYSFSRKLDIVAESNALVRRYRTSLKQFGQLRNAIVHEYRDEQIIAEPTESVVSEFQSIYNKITRPESAINVVGTHVVSIQKDCVVERAIRIMSENDISQVPVIGEEGFLGMFTPSMLFKTICEAQGEHLNSIMKSRMDEILKYSDRHRKVKFLNRHSSVFDVVEIYENTALKDHQIDAIIITESGEVHEMPLGIITDSDLPEIMKFI